MTEVNTTTNKIADMTSKIKDLAELLAPLNSDDRGRVIKATLTVLGEIDVQPYSEAHSTSSFNELKDNSTSFNFAPVASRWLKNNGLQTEQLAQVYHFENEEITLLNHDIPGNQQKTQTCNTYLLAGVKNFLKSGEASVDDKEARELCRSSGCFNSANHATYLKKIGKQLTGSRCAPWRAESEGA